MSKYIIIFVLMPYIVCIIVIRDCMYVMNIRNTLYLDVAIIACINIWSVAN